MLFAVVDFSPFSLWSFVFFHGYKNSTRPISETFELWRFVLLHAFTNSSCYFWYSYRGPLYFSTVPKIVRAIFGTDSVLTSLCVTIRLGMSGYVVGKYEETE